jgi:cobalt-zinc-cadmium efflux system outer membrane protein
VTALHEVDSRRREVEGFEPARIERAEAALRALGEEVQAGRLNLRDALIAQQTLVEFLRAHLAARWAFALASVELARVAGLLDDEGGRP